MVTKDARHPVPHLIILPLSEGQKWVQQEKTVGAAILFLPNTPLYGRPGKGPLDIQCIQIDPIRELKWPQDPFLSTTILAWP